MSEPQTRFDDETHMNRALELARIAVDRGDNPFGSVLVYDVDFEDMKWTLNGH